MRRADISIELPCTPERFWSLYLDIDFNARSIVEGLGWAAPTILESRADETEVIRNLDAKPQVKLDGKVAKRVGDRLGYREWGRFDRASSEFRFRQRTTIFGDKLAISGRMWAEPAGHAVMRWRASIEAEASIFGIGGLLERTVEQNVHQSFASLARFWKRWLAENPVD